MYVKKLGGCFVQSLIKPTGFIDEFNSKLKNSFLGVIREVFITIQQYFDQNVVRETIDLDKWLYSREKISTLNLKGSAEQQEVLRIFNSVVRRANRVYGIPEVMLELVTIQFTETDISLGKISLLGRKSQRWILQKGQLLIKVVP